MTESQVSREHRIWETPSGLLLIAGGKLTTYRSMAKQLVDVAERKLARLTVAQSLLRIPTPTGSR